MSWFKEWFDSPLYERIYADRDEREARRLVEWLHQIIPADSYPKILDLGCGWGRHALNLAEYGYRVHGVDLSESAIKKARSNAKERELTNVTFEIGDMREPLNDTYDTIVNLFTSFGYFEKDEENIKIIENVSGMLREEGIFVLDYFNPNRVRNNYDPHETGNVEDISYEINRFIENGSIIKKINFKSNGPKGGATYKERVKLYDLIWFKQVLSENNLNLEAVYGDYQGNPFDKTKSPRMILFARLEKE